MTLLDINIPQANILIIVQEVVSSLTMLVVLVPLAFIALAIKELENAEAMTQSTKIITFIDIPVRKECFAFTIGLSARHLAAVLTTIMGGTRAKCDTLTRYEKRKCNQYCR